VEKLGGRFSVFETFGDNPQGKSLNASHSFVPVGAVGHHTAQGGHFGQPAAIVFAFKFNRESHGKYCSIGASCLTSEWSRRGAEPAAARLIRRR
jgi:hypothetical protein